MAKKYFGPNRVSRLTRTYFFKHIRPRSINIPRATNTVSKRQNPDTYLVTFIKLLRLCGVVLFIIFYLLCALTLFARKIVK